MAPCGGDTFTAKLSPLGGGGAEKEEEVVDDGGGGGVGCRCRTLEMTVSPFKTSGRAPAATGDSGLSRRRLAASPVSPALSLF